MTRNLKIITAAIILFCGIIALRHLGTAIHDGCMDPREDCPPPIYLVGEVLYFSLGRTP